MCIDWLLKLLTAIKERLLYHLPTTKYLLICLKSMDKVTPARACKDAKLRKLNVTVPAPPNAQTTYAYKIIGNKNYSTSEIAFVIVNTYFYKICIDETLFKSDEKC